MAITKAVEALDVWAEIAQNAIREGAIGDLSPNYHSQLHLDLALTSEVAHTGTEIIVQIASAAADDEFWTDLVKFISITGTPAAETITNNPLAAAGTSITVASTTGLITDAKLLFLEDATLANSELVYQTAHVVDTSITILDGVKREHANTAVLYSLAQTYVIELPMSANRVRVLYNNKYDANGATVATRARISKVTAI